MVTTPKNSMENMVESDVITDAEADDEIVSEAVVRNFQTDADFDASELAMPVIRLGQQMHDEVANQEAKMGQWMLEGYEAVDEVIAMPIQFARWRAMREGSDDNKELVCQSADARIGVGKYGVNSELNPMGLCKDCPMAQWGPPNPKTGKGAPPPCQNGYDYVVISATHGGEIALIRMKGSAIRAGAKYLNSFIKSKGLGNFAIKLTSKIEKGKGNYAVPRVTLTAIPPELREQALLALPEGR